MTKHALLRVDEYDVSDVVLATGRTYGRGRIDPC